MKMWLLFSFFIYSLGAFSQDAYIFSTFTDPYTQFSDGISVVDEGWLDPQFNLPLGFDFSTINVTSDTLVSAHVGGTYSIFNEDQSAGAIFGVVEYFMDGSYINADQPSTITYKITGPEGSRICKVQLTDCAFLYEILSSDPSAQNRMSYQIWLYEGSNAVEIRFGPSQISNPQLVFEGRDGPLIVFLSGMSNFNIVLAEYGTYLEGDPQNPVLSEINLDLSPGLDAMPESGRVYRFEPVIVSVHETPAQPFQIYPTLVQNELSVEGEFKGLQRYYIHDITGKQIVSELISLPSTIHVDALTKGIYLLSLEKYVGAKKFVKH